jgi:hypothetical protein
MPQTIAPVYDFQIHIPDEEEILKAACSASNVTYTPSDKARHVRGVWALAREPAMFQKPEVINVIRVLTPESSRELIKQLKASPSLTEPEKQELRTLAAANRVTMRTLKEIASHSLLSSTPRQAVADALQDLVTTGMVIRGLRAGCPVCLVQHLYGLDEARPIPQCPGCGSDAAYAIDNGTGESALYYRINTLVQTLSLNGGLAPLAATALLTSENAYVVPGAQIFCDSTEAGEVDLLGWRRETLFAGEAKMSAGQLANSDHDKDVSKSVLVGADEHFAVCLEKIPAETRDALQSACERAGINLVILDPSNLFLANQPYRAVVGMDHVKEKVERSVRVLRTRDSFLLEHAAHERSITHKLAEYLQAEFSDYNVDCEYNKHGLATKLLPRECEERAREFVYPDIVVHARGNDDSNLLVVEAKLGNRATIPDCDAIKLIEFTKPDGEYHYQLGLFIGFDEQRDPQLVWYQDGRIETTG